MTAENENKPPATFEDMSALHVEGMLLALEFGFYLARLGFDLEQTRREFLRVYESKQE